jgi:hypothetical protein
MNEPQVDSETSRQKDFSAMKDWRLKHPVRHFIVVFSLLFTALSVVNALSVHLFQEFSETEIQIYSTSFLAGIFLFFMDRHRLKTSKR